MTTFNDAATLARYQRDFLLACVEAAKDGKPDFEVVGEKLEMSSEDAENYYKSLVMARDRARGRKETVVPSGFLGKVMECELGDNFEVIEKEDGEEEAVYVLKPWSTLEK